MSDIQPWPKWPLDIPAREVQLRALEKGYGKQGFAYFLRQRLGKTWLAYAEYKLLQEEGKVDWFVVICPNSIKQQWADSIEQVDPFTPVHIYNSQQKKKAFKWFKKNKYGGVFIINYESVRTFMEDQGWNVFDTIRSYIVADESTKIADFSAKMTKACLELASVCSYKRVLTGKPSKGSNADLWSQLKFINATERNFHQHKYHFCIVGGYHNRQVLKNINEEELRTEMEPYCYIAEDKYVQGFKKVYEPFRQIELSGELLAMYTAMEDSLIVELSSDVQMTAPIVLVKYLRLQQISSGIGGDIEGKQHNLIDPSRNPKIKIVKEILSNEVSNKVIICCRFRLSIDNLYNELTKAGYKCAVMTGGMGKTLEEEKKKFTEGDHDVLIAQLQVLNFGHTLCGPDDNPCLDIIYYENDFSLINRAQTESRPEKFDRDMSISIWDMYASNMERHIIEALIHKEDASLAIMGYARERGILYREAPDEEPNEEDDATKDIIDC